MLKPPDASAIAGRPRADERRDMVGLALVDARDSVRLRKFLCAAVTSALSRHRSSAHGKAPKMCKPVLR